MPTISVFYGMTIAMFWDEHVPPHFHVRYGDIRATVNIQPVEMASGNLPPNARRMVLEWAKEHQAELRENWILCEQQVTPNKILPLK